MKFIELFCGIGGFRLGLEKSNGQYQEDTEVGRCGDSIGNQGEQSKQSKEWRNYTCVWANDNDRYACQIYRKHWGEVYEGNIRTVDPSTIPEHDLLTAGFPCQSFSIAGKRGGFEDTRGTLFFEICRILRAKGTKYVWLENVEGLLSHDNGVTFQTIIGMLDELGYDCQWQVLNSKDYGVPQNRKRVFIIGHLRGQPRPKVFPIGETDEVYSEANGVISHSIDSIHHKGWLNNQQRTMVFVRGVMGEDNKKWLEDGKEFSRNFPQGQRVYSVDGISAQLNAQAGGWGAKTGLYEVPKVAQALQTDGQLRQGVSWGTDKPQSARNIRRLTPLECERLQGFPDGWTEGISDTQRYKCLGNAVTVNVIEAIGRQWSYE